ncbi:LSM8 homolog, U6 small nuclear RNA associated isoform X2 [Peromyscus leucopus]|uniref:LSM8 homolog, U6 small nuclear RNA associated isoform X2 n=1 Tax=Peromyscus leucopus TaxID=10041 RepID=UPI0010A147A7|nr:LSM8 homolog, U6 small nuclear RNA associated isoform X2 [Peromyscus leucopus]
MTSALENYINRIRGRAAAQAGAGPGAAARGELGVPGRGGVIRTDPGLVPPITDPRVLRTFLQVAFRLVVPDSARLVCSNTGTKMNCFPEDYQFR